MEHQDALKRARRNMIGRATGSNTPSNAYALLSVSPNFETATLELPVFTPSASLGSLQGPDGVPYFMPDYDVVDSLPVF